VLEISQVDLNQEVHIPGVHHFGKRMIESSVRLLLPRFFIHDVCLELQILASVVTQSACFIWQGKPVDESISGHLLFSNKSDFYRGLQFFNVTISLRINNLFGRGLLIYKGILVL